MLEVVFGDSVKGSMKFAGAGGGAGLGRVGGPGADGTLTATVPVTAGVGRAVSIGYALDVGDISGGILGRGREDAYDLLWGRFGRFHGGDGAAERSRYFGELEKDLQGLMDAASAGGPVRIWLDRSPATVCGFYAVCDALRGMDCPVYVVELPEYELVKPDVLCSCSGWGEVTPDRLGAYAETAYPLHPLRKLWCANRWRELMAENAPLRAVVNGALMSVPEGFYDHLIERHIPDGEFVMARLIGEILGKNPIGVGDSWYACRIDRMLEEGRLKAVGSKDDSHPYGAVLAKAK